MSKPGLVLKAISLEFEPDETEMAMLNAIVRDPQGATDQEREGIKIGSIVGQVYVDEPEIAKAFRDLMSRVVMATLSAMYGPDAAPHVISGKTPGKPS